MDKEPKMYGEDDDMEDIYDDPSLDYLYTTLCRSDDKEWRKKELSRKTKQLSK